MIRTALIYSKGFSLPFEQPQEIKSSCAPKIEGAFKVCIWTKMACYGIDCRVDVENPVTSQT
jgi:hypothetical protein